MSDSARELGKALGEIAVELVKAGGVEERDRKTKWL